MKIQQGGAVAVLVVIIIAHGATTKMLVGVAERMIVGGARRLMVG